MSVHFMNLPFFHVDNHRNRMSRRKSWEGEGNQCYLTSNGNKPDLNNFFKFFHVNLSAAGWSVPGDGRAFYFLTLFQQHAMALGSMVHF